MNVELNERDMKLLKFLAEYKKVKATDIVKIYKSKWYIYKRLKILQDGGYIIRENKYYLKLDIKGIQLMTKLGYNKRNMCRSQKYRERLKDILKIATITLDSDIKFVPSWRVKDNEVFTQKSRLYIGKMIYQEDEFFVYYISNERNEAYIRKIHNDISKLVDKDNVIIFTEKEDTIINRNDYFRFGNKSTIIIKSTIENLDNMKKIHETYMYEMIKKMYEGKEILVSNWEKADFMTEDYVYLVIMPFIDTEKLYSINVFYNSNESNGVEINIVTLEENKDVICKILDKPTKIVDLDAFLGGQYGKF